jgi:hypothetical protein
MIVHGFIGFPVGWTGLGEPIVGWRASALTLG